MECTPLDDALAAGVALVAIVALAATGASERHLLGQAARRQNRRPAAPAYRSPTKAPPACPASSGSVCGEDPDDCGRHEAEIADPDVDGEQEDAEDVVQSRRRIATFLTEDVRTRRWRPSSAARMWIVLDAVGAGELPDAVNTGTKAEHAGQRRAGVGGLDLPNLEALGPSAT